MIVWTGLLRVRWALWTAVAVVAAYFARLDDPPDLLGFAQRGSDLMSGRLDQVYAGAWNQAGPLQLLGARVLLLGSSTDRPLLVVEVLVDVALLVLLAVVCRRSGVPPVGQFALAAATVVWFGPAGLWSGHPVEIAIPLLWLGAAEAARRNRGFAAGALLAASVAVAPWAVLAFPIVFLGRTRAAFAALAAMVAIVLAAYLPFALSGSFGMFHNTWLVNSQTLIHLIAPDVRVFGWGLRLIQGALAAGAAFVVVRWRRGDLDARWAAPLLAVLLRILLDPVLLSYYWQPAALLVIAGAAMRVTTGRREVMALAGLGYLTYFGAAGALPTITCLAAVAALIMVLRPGPASVAVGERFRLAPAWRRMS